MYNGDAWMRRQSIGYLDDPKKTHTQPFGVYISAGECFDGCFEGAWMTLDDAEAFAKAILVEVAKGRVAEEEQRGS